MRGCLINKSTVFIILFSGALFCFCNAQISGSIQGQLLKNDSTGLVKAKAFLVQAEKKIITDSTVTDTNGVFLFENIALGNYSIWLKDTSVDNTVADIISISEINPAKRNQHFKIEDGSLVCVENNYTNLKDALENKENVFVLNLNNLQFDVAEKSLLIATDGTKKLNSAIGEFTNLESLLIDINLISFLPSEIGNLNKLTLLSANLNKLRALPDEMISLKNLKTLNLGKNDFQKFPELITNYFGLEILNFESNPIINLPPTINAMKSLKELNLANCFNLSSLPAEIGELSNLEMLDISNCGSLKELPYEIIQLKNLKVLDISGTRLSVKIFQKAVPTCEVKFGK